MDLTNAIVAGVSVCLGSGATGYFSWLNERIKASSAAKVAAAQAEPSIAASQAAFANTLNTQTESFIKVLREERSHLEAKVEALETRVHDQDGMIESLKRAHEECLGENRNADQRYQSLEAELRRLGVPIHPSAKATGLIELSGGKATMLMQTHDKPPRRRRRSRKEVT